MLKPRALTPGDRVAVVAPASPFPREEFDAGVEEVRRLGFEPVFDESVFARGRFVAGPAGVRASALRAAWTDPSIGGILAARGGYGSVQMLPLLDAEEIARAPKVFVGYSDITALLTYLTIGCGVVAFHGPMLAGRLSEGVAKYDRASLLGAVGRAEPLGELAPEGLESLQEGEAAGPLLGGNLSQLVASLGTPYAFTPPAGHVLWIEEVGERPYRLDRMLTQLRQAGVLTRAAAVVMGDMPGCDEPGAVHTARAAVAEALSGFSGPILFGLPSGHTLGAALTLPLGVRCRVVARGRPRVVVEEAAVV
jgi:muramoyltetrapeptide carboxypeptidase